MSGIYSCSSFRFHNGFSRFCFLHSPKKDVPCKLYEVLPLITTRKRLVRKKAGYDISGYLIRMFFVIFGKLRIYTFNTCQQ